ncbi:hypothetical protein IJO12_01065 [bacterium]|nr:hypothetical protein [bacterium]
MLYLNKFLSAIKENSEILKSAEANYILGLTSGNINNLKKYALENGFIDIKKGSCFLTSSGEDYLLLNPILGWCSNEYPLRPNVNLEYLKDEKTSPALTKAIRNLAKHIINKEDIKKYSLEHVLLDDIERAGDLIFAIEGDIFSENKIPVKNIYDKYLQYGITKSLISVILLHILSNNIDKIAIYEKSQFQLKFDTLMFDRIVAVPQNFEIQKTEIDESEMLENLAIIILTRRSKNILDITKGLIKIIKQLDKYTLNTQNLSKNTLRLRNAIVNAKDPISLFNRDIPRVFNKKELKDCDIEFLSNFYSSLEELKTNEITLNSELKDFIFKTFTAKSRKELAKRFNNVKEYIGENDLKILSNSVIENESDDQLWVNRIATFIHKLRVPKDWNDEDYADFKLKTKELALKFFIIESTAGSLATLKTKKNHKLLDDYLNLSKSEQISFLRTVVNI